MIILILALLGESEQESHGCVDLACSEKGCQNKPNSQNSHENTYLMNLRDAG